MTTLSSSLTSDPGDDGAHLATCPCCDEDHAADELWPCDACDCWVCENCGRDGDLGFLCSNCQEG